MIKLASREFCTGCGACAYKCPKSCISMMENVIGEVLPQINTEECIQCHLCEKVCPILSAPTTAEPQECYAAWSKDITTRLTSASGGIAYELYKNAVDNGCYAVGASINEDFSVSLEIADCEKELEPFKNSKYVFSDGHSIYPEIGKLLKQQKKIIIAGLPCQIAAFKNIFHNNENLILIEILCHGTSPYSYLKQHIETIKLRTKSNISQISFRDPANGTIAFVFSCYQGERPIYQAQEEDSYMYSFHNAISYRESCYHCHFAKNERVGDLVLCDFYGLGKEFKCSYREENVSCVLLVTPKGQSFFNGLKSNNCIFVEKRDVHEAKASNPRLTCPSPKSKERLLFEKNINNSNGNFEKAIAPILNAYTKKKNASFKKKLLYILIDRIRNILGL